MPMIEDLDLLASRIAQLSELAIRLRAENEKLSQDLVQRYIDIHRLREALTAAHSRVDAVLTRLPGIHLEAVPPDDSDTQEVTPPDDEDATISNDGEAYGTH